MNEVMTTNHNFSDRFYMSLPAQSFSSLGLQTTEEMREGEPLRLSWGLKYPRRYRVNDIIRRERNQGLYGAHSTSSLSEDYRIT